MNLIKFSINKPVGVIVGIIMIVLFGLIGLNSLPYQLSPSVVEPNITVTTTWRGATPYEVEREIIEQQENTLKGIPGLTEMESEAHNGRGTITLRFSLDTEVDNALLRVSNKVNEVRSYPEGADKPVISATGSATSPVVWVVMKTLPGNDRHINTYITYFEDEVRQYIERVEGVADLFVGGGTPDQMQVIVDPGVLASYQLTINDIISSLRAENVNISAGNMGVGRRDYRIRTTGEFKNAGDIRSVVIKSTGQRRIVLGDVAEVHEGYEKRSFTVIHNSEPAMAVGIKPEPGTNILELTERVEEVVNWLNKNKLEPRGLTFHWVYDQRFYINGAINLIKKNILIGGILAAIVLLGFLRSVRSTLVVAISMPISIIGTFLFMYILGRNLNVVSLAGIAFAVGMLVDNAIVVMENIDRHRKGGKSAFRAAYDGTSEVWGAVLASTLTTVAVFLPIVFMKEEAGQLFKDIAIAVVSAVTISLVVSVSVIPMLSSRLLSTRSPSGLLRRFTTTDGKESKLSGLNARITGAGHFAAQWITGMVNRAISSTMSRAVTVLALTMIAGLTVLFLMPKPEYLPQGNRNFILTLLVPPPGLSTEERDEIGKTFFESAGPYIGKEEHNGMPGILNMFFVGRDSIMLAGAMSTQWDRASELLPLFRKTLGEIPGMFGVSMQVGIFQNRLGRSRTVDVDISGDDLNSIITAAGMMFGKIRGVISGAQVRPIPSIELLYPEVRLVPNRDRLKANGMSSEDLGLALDVLLDGRDIGDFKAEGKKKVDLILKTDNSLIQTPEDLYDSLITTPGGKIVQVSSLSSLERGYGITQIRHLERNRAITLQVTPPETMPLQSAMELIEEKIIRPMKEEGDALKGLSVRMSGAADKLTQTSRALKWNFVLAAAIAYLLMSALFGNFIYPLIIMFTVPLAGAGGFMGLRLLNLAGVNQQMDILTMLGFIILIGVVVNNAILIVHQSLNNVRHEGMDYEDAIMDAVKTRLRPIYMSACTSIFGMLPLVVFPGAGSELYRGIGSVMLGGIAISTVFTVFIIPSLLMFAIKLERPGISMEQVLADKEGEA